MLVGPLAAVLAVGLTAGCTAARPNGHRRSAASASYPQTLPGTHWAFDAVVVGGKRLSAANGYLDFASDGGRYNVGVLGDVGCSWFNAGKATFGHTTARFQVHPQRPRPCEPGNLTPARILTMSHHRAVAEALARVLTGRTTLSGDGRTITFSRPGEGQATFRRR